MTGPRARIVMISVAFGEFWNDLAADLGITIDLSGPEDPAAPPPETVVVILGAGGAERDAIAWLDRHPVPRGLPVFVVGTDPGRRTAMEAVTRGARDYFALPEDLEIFRNAMAAAVRAGGKREKDASGAGAGPFAKFVGDSLVLRHELERAARVMAHRNARALLLGETGTGKELLARAIHAGGPRHDAPFVAVNCSALPEHLIESELFGHERGSFTDAHAAKPGLFEVADTGTLFLDEIGDLPLGVQAKLLRVLEDGEIRRVGGTKSRTVDVRVLAATDDRLPERVREGRFRPDLFFRLSTVVFRLPPLRDRGDDAVTIAEALLARFAGEHGLPVPPLSAEARDRIRTHPWPGNVRELSNAVERALLLSAPGELNLDELLPAPPMQPRDGALPFPAPLRQITTAAVQATIKLCNGNRSESARQLGISPKRLRRLLNGAVASGDW